MARQHKKPRRLCDKSRGVNGRYSAMTSIPTKPLELTVFHRDEDGDYRHPLGFWIPQVDVDHWAEAKNFSDAELTAEYWASYAEYVREASNVLHCQERYMEAAGASFQEADRKARILHRFATLPHYDEVPS